MLFNIVGYVMFKLAYRDIGDLFQAILLLGTIISIIISGFKLHKDIIFRCFLISLIIPVISWVNSIIYIPDLARKSPEINALYHFFTFWPIAYWVRGNRRYITVVLFGFCIGVILTCYSHSNMVIELLDGLRGQRVDFNVVNAQHPSLLSGFSLIICLFYAFKIIKMRQYNLISILKNSSIIFLSIIFLLILLVTQTRQVWLALVSTLLIIPAAYNLYSTIKINKKKILTIYLLIILILISFSSINIVNKRLKLDIDNIKKIACMNFANITSGNSSRIRVQLWHEGVEWIKKRPLLGSGDHSRALVVSQSQYLSESIKHKINHLHNSHIETMVSYGIIGSLFVYFVMLYPVMLLLHNKQKDIDDFKTLAIAFTVYWMIVNIFESYFYAKSGELLLSVYLSVIYSFNFADIKYCNNDSNDIN